MKRDACTDAEARARIDAQMPLAAKVAVADYVIDNDGSPEATATSVATVHEALLAQWDAPS